MVKFIKKNKRAFIIGISIAVTILAVLAIILGVTIKKKIFDALKIKPYKEYLTQYFKLKFHWDKLSLKL